LAGPYPGGAHQGKLDGGSAKGAQTAWEAKAEMAFCGAWVATARAKTVAMSWASWQVGRLSRQAARVRGLPAATESSAATSSKALAFGRRQALQVCLAGGIGRGGSRLGYGGRAQTLRANNVMRAGDKGIAFSVLGVDMPRRACCLGGGCRGQATGDPTVSRGLRNAKPVRTA